MRFWKKAAVKTRDPLLVVLETADWYPGRSVSLDSTGYQHNLGHVMFPFAQEVAEEFGGLLINHSLWFVSNALVHHLYLKPDVELGAGCPCCPIAGSAFMGEDCAIWVDVKQRFYAVDAEGMLYLAKGKYQALRVLLCKTPVSKPDELDGMGAVRGGWGREWPLNYGDEASPPSGPKHPTPQP